MNRVLRVSVARVHNPRRFAALLRDIQERSGLSQERIGALAGANRSTVNRWMRGKQQPQYMHVSRLARLIRADYPELDEMVGDMLAAAGYGVLGEVPAPADGPDGLPPMSDDERRAVLSYLEVRRAAERGA